MKNYEEMAAEAIRRRDIYLQQRCGRIKKAALILTVLLLFTVVGTASVMIGLNTKDAPKKPPKVTYTVGSGTDSTSDTENSEREDFTTETVDTSDTTETDVTDTTEKSEVSDTESEPIPEIPNDEPTELQTTEPTEEPIEAPTEVPSEEPTELQTSVLTEEPTERPTTSEDDEPHSGTEEGSSTSEIDVPVDKDPVPPAHSPDTPEDPIDGPSQGGLKYYKNSMDYGLFVYYFDDSFFLDDPSQIPAELSGYNPSQSFYTDTSWVQRFKEYLKLVYGNGFYPNNFSADNTVYESYDENVMQGNIQTVQKHPIRFNRESHAINMYLKVNGYGEVDRMLYDDVILFIGQIDHYKAALKFLGINDPVVKVTEYCYRTYGEDKDSYRYYVSVCDRSDISNYLDPSARKGSISFSFSVLSGEKVMHTHMAVMFPFDMEELMKKKVFPYEDAVAHVLSKYDYGNDFEYVKENLKCIARIERSALQTMYPAYEFYIKYSDSNGNAYYRSLGEYSMFNN